MREWSERNLRWRNRCAVAGDRGVYNTMTGNIWWIGPVVVVLLRVLYAEARTSRASGKNGDLIFRAAPGVLILFTFGIAVLTFLLVRSLGKEETWIIVSGAVLTILLCLAWPSTIVTNTTGIARYLWWKPTINIPWDAVVELERSAGGDWTVCGKDDKTIVFSRYHADPSRFEAEVLKRAKLSCSKDRSSPTTLSGLDS